jgi:hypothetical protein
MYWASLVVLAVQGVALVLGVRAMYRNYGRYGRADHGNMQPLIAIFGVTIAADQIIQVIRDPSQTISWVVLGIVVLGSVFFAVSLVRTRLRTARH